MKPGMSTLRGVCFGLLLTLLAIGIGCGGSREEGPSPPRAMERVRVGTILPLTGPAAQLGQDERAGIRLAVEAFAPTRRMVDFVIEDSQLKAPTAVTIVKKMLEVDRIGVFIASTSGIVLAVTPTIADFRGDKLLFAVHTAPGATRGYPFMFRLYPSADREVKVAADYAIRRGFRRVGAFCLANQAGEQAVALFRDEMKNAGIELAVAETFAPTQTDFRQTLLKFKQARVEALLVMGYTSHYKPIFRQMIEAGIDATVLGGVATPLGNMEAELPISFLSRVVFPGGRLYYAPDSPTVVAFAQRAKAAKIDVNYEVAYAFDCATTLMMAADAAEAPTPSAIATAVRKITPFEGVTGTISFDADRDIVVDLRPCTWTPSGIRLAQ